VPHLSWGAEQGRVSLLSGWWTVEGVDGANERSEGAPIQLGASSIPIAEAEDSALPHDEPASR
jgi:hypothetical protein